jgi:hypothetical protein
MDKSENIIEFAINNAIDTRFHIIEEADFSEIKDKDANECAKNTSRIIELEKNIKSMVSEEAYNIYLEIESLTIINTSIENQYMFKKGVIEGLTTLKYLNAVSECVNLPLIKL